MIMILDNGGEYSDHAIYFVDIGRAEPALIEAALAKNTASDPLYVIAFVESISWRKPEASIAFAEFADDLRYKSYCVRHAEGCKGEEDDRAPCTCWIAELAALARGEGRGERWMSS